MAKQYNFNRSGAQRIKDQTRTYVPPDASNRRERVIVPPIQNRDHDVLVVQNKTGSQLNPQNIVRLGAYIRATSFNAKEFRLRPVLEGLTPNTTDQDRFGVIVRTCQNNKLSPAVVHGTVTCKVDMQDASHKFAQAKNGSVTELESVAFGSTQILWAESGTGVKNAMVRIGSGGGGFNYAYVKLKETLLPSDYSCAGLMLHHVGVIEHAVGATIVLTNTIQTYDGVTNDICVAIPRPAVGNLQGVDTEYEIFSKPCAPNTVNTPNIDTNPTPV